MRILLVDDDVRISNFVAKGLRENSYAVDAVTDGEEALYEASINDNDIIILDVMIPKKEGFAVCVELRNSGLKTPILIVGFCRDVEPCTTTIDGRPINRTGYEVIVTKDVPDDPNGFSRPTFDVRVPPSETSLTVPSEFLEPGTRYELEVLALEVSGNQTLSSLFFETQ